MNKKILIRFLDRGQIQEAIQYLADCIEDNQEQISNIITSKTQVKRE